MIAETAQVVHSGWWDSPVLIALLSTFATCFTVAWQGRKGRQSTEREGEKAQAIGEAAGVAAQRAASNAATAAQVAQRAASNAATAAQVGQDTHNLVNGHREAMERLIVELRAEIASLKGQPRPSDAVLGIKLSDTRETAGCDR